MFLSTIKERQVSENITLLEIENAHATATISLHGAQVISYKPKHDSRERLFLSSKARWDGSKSIRGGIPICWPWFGAHKENPQLPMHGYIRTQLWDLQERDDFEKHTRLLFKAKDTCGLGFTGSATLTLEVLIGTQLSVTLHTTNTGVDAFNLSCALHTYFAVADIHQTRLKGLEGLYSDKTRQWATFPTPVPYKFTEVTDRIHLHAAPSLIVLEQINTTAIVSSGHDSIVVWNPWSECAQLFPDIQADEYQQMLCVETAVTQGFMLQPQQSHALAQIIE